MDWAHRWKEEIIFLYVALVRPRVDTASNFGPLTEENHEQSRATSAGAPTAAGAGAFVLPAWLFSSPMKRNKGKYRISRKALKYEIIEGSNTE